MPPKIRVLQCVVEADEICREDFRRVRDSGRRRKMLRRWGTVVPHRHAHCEQRLREIIQEVDWSKDDEGRILMRYAKYCIRTWRVAWCWSGAQDLISETLLRCLTGDRKLHYPSRRALPGFLCFTMKSIVRCEKEKAKRHGDQTVMEQSRTDLDDDSGRPAQLPILPIVDADLVADLLVQDLFQTFLATIEDLDLRTYLQHKKDHPDWGAEDHAHAIGVEIQDIYNLNRRLHRLRERWTRLGGSPPPPPRRPRPRRRG